ncbi:putative zinc finger protein [Trypanosoma grayi]|uniref:putative zinc finger protein n=1 Tax=Trypanosoma grayi TaxID=71804 RepID=UPI0004F448E3|nr:putative zinc finger protein [Trypanosoma grayi]KEG15028.1 putative zinc finger protein [Trypanosoma grayi]
MGAADSRDDHWQKDSEAPECRKCGVTFSLSIRRHHCRNCGYVFCKNCSPYSSIIPMRGVYMPVRVCSDCFHALRKDGGATACGGDISATQRGPSLTSTTYESNDGSYTGLDAPISPSAAVGTNWDGNNSQFVGAGGVETENEALAYYDSYARPTEVAAATAYVVGDKTAARMEKERLFQCWMDVRQRAVFTDILLQQVERVDENTEVVYCLEIENIKLQPEQPEHLNVLFPFPEGGDGNAELLMEPVDSCIPALQGESEAVDTALKQLAAQLSLPPAVVMCKSDSVELRQF